MRVNTFQLACKIVKSGGLTKIRNGRILELYFVNFVKINGG